MICNLVGLLLMTALGEERTIFDKFSLSKRISFKAVAFATPTAEKEAHWNMVYPEEFNYVYTREELSAIDEYYRQLNLVGHVATFDDKWEKLAVETAEYFVLDKPREALVSELTVEEFTELKGQDLADFSTIVGKSLSLDEPTVLYFQNQMVRLAGLVKSHFWIASSGGKRCGTASTFQTSSGAEFLFNVGVLPEFQKKGLGSAMMQRVVQSAGRPLYVYTENAVTRSKVYPGAGFTSLGKLHVVRTDIYRQFQYPVSDADVK